MDLKKSLNFTVSPKVFDEIAALEDPDEFLKTLAYKLLGTSDFHSITIETKQNDSVSPENTIY